MANVLYICDWLPPDFGAVGQYSLLFAAQRAEAGDHVLLAGLSSTRGSHETQSRAQGKLEVLRLRTKMLDRKRFLRRLPWTLWTNARLLWSVRRRLLSCDQIVLTGSPPFLLHYLAPLNLVLRKRLIYRITDFHPECLMAGLARSPWLLRLFFRLTVFWRRRVDHFEVLGEDQRRRLLDLGIRPERIELKRDPTPTPIDPAAPPLERPTELAGKTLLLYSGNFGVAHDHETLLSGYEAHHRRGSGRVALWLNAMGAKADYVERWLRAQGLPIVRSRPVPLDQLNRLLVTPDAHLITLSNPFIGYVLPSKVYGCVASGHDVLFIGSDRSDVDLLCRQAQMPADAYQRVSVDDVAGVAAALERIADRTEQRFAGRNAGVVAGSANDRLSSRPGQNTTAPVPTATAPTAALPSESDLASRRGASSRVQ